MSETPSGVVGNQWRRSRSASRWLRNLIDFYSARELVEFDSLTHVPRWLEQGLARPAVQRGLNIPKRL